MASDDPIFDKALVRHLRSTPPEATPAQSSQCADAETLAAYHERLLAPSELNAWKEHIAGCQRCQEILAQLEATDEIPLGVAGMQPEDSRVLIMQPVASHSPSQVPAPAQAISPVASMQPRRISPATRRWIAPAGAIAAGLLAWVVWHEDHSKNIALQPAAPAIVAENRRSDSAPALPKSTPSALPADAEATPKPNLTAPARVAATLPKAVTREYDSPASGDRVNELDRDHAISDLRKVPALKDSARAKSQVGPSNHSLQQQANAREYSANGKVGDFKQDAPAFDGSAALGGKAGAAGAPSASPPPAPASTALSEMARSRSENAKLKKESSEEKTAPPVVLAQTETGRVISTETQSVMVTSDGANALVSASAAGLVAGTGSRIIPVPGSKIIWKIENDGRLRRTADLGDSWQLQNVGVNTTLLSGSAPSEKVCWLVGTFGAVLVTTDAGAHWTKRSLPVTSSVDRILAFDAKHAVASLQSTTITFETFDNGQTWTLLTKK